MIRHDISNAKKIVITKRISLFDSISVANQDRTILLEGYAGREKNKQLIERISQSVPGGIDVTRESFHY